MYVALLNLHLPININHFGEMENFLNCLNSREVLSISYKQVQRFVLSISLAGNLPPRMVSETFMIDYLSLAMQQILLLL